MFRLSVIIGAGGFIGALLRFQLSLLIQTRSWAVGYPFGTLAVNMIGCLLIGFLSALAEKHPLLSSVELRNFLLAGVLGGFTTFSAFGNDVLNLIRAGRVEAAALNAGIQVVLGVNLVWLGRMLGKVL